MTRLSLILTLGALVALAPAAASADDDDKSGVLTTWIVTQGDAAVGSETLRLVKKDGGVFASGDRNLKKAKKKEHVQYFLQRSGGDLVKYRRAEAGRKGEGVMVFTVDGRLRITGVNTGVKTTDLADVSTQHVWDARFPSHLAFLAPKLKGDSVSVPWFDPGSKKTGTARLVRGAAARLADAKKQPVEVTTWTTEGQPGPAATLYVDGAGHLVGVKLADEALLLKGWGWEGKAPEADVDDDDAKKPVDPDDDGSNDPGEGP
ncbi:MAG: hypothetical protein KC635_15870 [Myxococcales bacterium]|nr:hypothetical protein [Myxococcales bacterium]MCB9735654.1 hypothetical protein [Deltaproteobacteria bacterium]